MKKKGLITIGSTVAVAVIALSAVMVFGGNDNDNEKETIISSVDVLEPVTEAPTPEPTEFIEPTEAIPGLTKFAEMMLRENEDIVGHIKISNTYVDYPVVQYQSDDPEDLEEEGNVYYLEKDLYGNYLDSGSVFMDYRDDFGADKSKQSENLVLYGHNMLNGSKFATLHYYRQDDSFYDENPIIEFSSNYEDYKYIIIGYFITSGDYGESYYGEEFAYWDQQDLSDKKDFDKYVEIVNERSMISPGIDVTYGDQLLTLSTCHLDVDNSRFLVVARRLRDDETVDNIDMAKGASKPDSTPDSEEE